MPRGIEKDERGVVLIKKSNVEKIRSTLSSHESYRYTSAVDFIFKATKPLAPESITLEQIIARLIIINQIDGTNLTTSFGADAFFRIASSIYDNGFEALIANKQAIPNDNFQNVAIRTSVHSDEKKLKLFSVVTKYIARTAHYIYNNDNDYPIYDSVLGSNLKYYLSKDVSIIRKDCDYKAYCDSINGYLASINKELPANQKISNMDFDLIVWFSYKPANAPRKYN